MADQCDKQNNIESEPRFVETIKILKTMITDYSRVVEIGSSDASFRKFMSAKEWLTVDKYGSPDICTDINGPDVTLPFEDNSIDVIICTEVLEHLTMGGPLVEEMARILNDSGRAIVSVPNIASFRSRIKVLLGLLPDLPASGDCGTPLGGTGILIEGHWVASHVVDFNTKRLKLYLERGGLRLVRHWRMPTSIGRAGYSPMTIKLLFLPKTLSDYVLFELRKQDEGEMI